LTGQEQLSETGPVGRRL